MLEMESFCLFAFGTHGFPIIRLKKEHLVALLVAVSDVMGKKFVGQSGCQLFLALTYIEAKT